MSTRSIFTQHKRGEIIIFSPLDGRQHSVKFDPHNSKSFDEAERTAERTKTSIIEAITKKLGRTPSPREIQQGRADGVDSRNSLEKMRDSDWRPVKRTNLSSLEKLLAETNERIATTKCYTGMTADEARRQDLENMIARDQAEAAAEEAQRRHLANVKPKLDLITRLEADERWSPTASEAFRASLRKCREQLECVDGDEHETASLLQDVRDVVRHRTLKKQFTLQQQQTMLLSELKQSQAELDALQPDLIERETVVTDADLECEMIERGIIDDVDARRRYSDARLWDYDGDQAQQYAESGKLPETKE